VISSIECDPDMAWIFPQYDADEYDAAGQVLATSTLQSGDPSLEDALEAIGNWRSSHAYPLLAMRMTLTNRSQTIHGDTIIAQRLKRLSSIAAKLRRMPKLRLSEIQDIAGCRAVMQNTAQVRELVDVYERSHAKNPHKGHRRLWTNDYISSPKKSGYRSYHIIYGYQSESAQYQALNGLRIEIQLRSRAQHAWATAVETVDAFTHQSLKSSLGDPRWRRFFALMGSAMALAEKQALVPNTPPTRAELVEELKSVSDAIQAEHVLEGLGVATSSFTRATADAEAFLLRLDTAEHSLSAKPYTRAELPQATEDYLSIEKEISGNPSVQAVLVSVDKLANLRKAYPNYYVDLDTFRQALRRALAPVPRRSR
jgi:hypothetical protein